MSEIDAELEALVEEFDLLGTSEADWEERYRYVIDLGRDLPPLAETEKTDRTKVAGCASQVWLVSEGDSNRLRFRGDSDAHIVRGLMAILLRLFSGRRADDILAFDAEAAVARLGLGQALSSQRANGLASMVRRIRAEAEAAQARG